MLCPIGGIEQEFGQGLDVFTCQQSGADDFPQCRPTRLAGRKKCDSSLGQICFEPTQLGRFTAPIDPFKSDQFASLHLPERWQELQPNLLARLKLPQNHLSWLAVQSPEVADDDPPPVDPAAGVDVVLGVEVAGGCDVCCSLSGRA